MCRLCGRWWEYRRWSYRTNPRSATDCSGGCWPGWINHRLVIQWILIKNVAVDLNRFTVNITSLLFLTSVRCKKWKCVRLSLNILQLVFSLVPLSHNFNIRTMYITQIMCICECYHQVVEDWYQGFHLCLFGISCDLVWTKKLKFSILLWKDKVGKRATERMTEKIITFLI